MVRLIAQNEVKLEHLSEALNLYKELVQKTREESGCIRYDLYVDEKNENHFTFFEEWRDEKALEAHRNSEHFTRIIPQLTLLRSKPSHVIFLKEFDKYVL